MAKNKEKKEKEIKHEEEIEITQPESQEKPESQEGAEEMLLLSKAEVDELKSSLEEARKKEQEAKEDYLRERAEMSNYRKLIERDQVKARQDFKADVLKKFLVVQDDLSLAYQHRPQDGEAASWAEGLELILRKFHTLFESEGLEQIKAEAGMEFDPTLHQAIASDESDTYKNGEIIEVLQTGYRMGDRVIRPALVRVAK